MVSTHAVVAGETLSALALRFYGDAELYRLIAAASGIADPDVVNVGQRLIMPDFTRYTVVAGDTLSALAARFYGDASLYPLIAAVNGIADPGVIDVGQVLVIFIGRSDGFGLRIVDRNENDPRLWYYRFQTSAIGWNPGVNVLLPDDYRTSGRTYPVLYLFHGGGTDQDFRTFDFLGIRDLTAGKPIIIVMPTAARGLVFQPGQLVRRPTELGDIPHRPAAPLDRGELPNLRRIRRPRGRRVFDGWLRRAEVRSKVLRPLRVGEQPLRTGKSAPRLRPGSALGKPVLGGAGSRRRHGLRRAALGPS